MVEKKRHTPTRSRVSPVVQDLAPKSISAERFVYIYIYICYIFYRAKQLACTSPGGDADINVIFCVN